MFKNWFFYISKETKKNKNSDSEIKKYLSQEFVKMDANAGNPSVQSYRHCLKVSVGALMLESGFNGCEKMSLETLTELCQSFLKECGRSSRAFCELAGRTDVLG